MQVYSLWFSLRGTVVDVGGRVVGGDDGFEVVTFPPLLLTVIVIVVVAVCCERGSGRNLLCLIECGLFQISAVHHGKGGCVGGQQSVGTG